MREKLDTITVPVTAEQRRVIRIVAAQTDQPMGKAAQALIVERLIQRKLLKKEPELAAR